MRILTRDEIRAVENRAFDGLFTESQLMERAGLMCADKMLALYGDQMKGQPVAVVCGNGKNAGDGFVIARRLRAADVPAYIVLADQAPTLPEPLAYYNAAVEDGVDVRSFSNEAVHAPLWWIACLALDFTVRRDRPLIRYSLPSTTAELR